MRSKTTLGEFWMKGKPCLDYWPDFVKLLYRSGLLDGDREIIRKASKLMKGEIGKVGYPAQRIVYGERFGQYYDDERGPGVDHVFDPEALTASFLSEIEVSLPPWRSLPKNVRHILSGIGLLVLHRVLDNNHLSASKAYYLLRERYKV